MVKITGNSGISEPINSRPVGLDKPQNTAKIDNFNISSPPTKLASLGAMKMNALFGGLKVDLSEVADGVNIAGDSIGGIDHNTSTKELFDILASV